MLEPPADLSESDLLAGLRAGWEIEAAHVAFLPLGAGSHQWSVRGSDGAAWFVKVDDLGVDPAGRDTAFARLRRSLQTAITLRESGLDFVLAPVGGARRLSPRYAQSVFPLVEGVSGPFAPHPPADRPAIAALLARLHDATPAVAGPAPSGWHSATPAESTAAPAADLSLPGRAGLEAALHVTGRPWTSGPYAEPARAALAAAAPRVTAWLTEFDRLAAAIPADRVVTHGEPHPGNFLRTGDGRLLLIDWDTVAMGPPERDLWMLTAEFAGLLGEPADGDDEAVLRAYGRAVRPEALSFYRLRWVLADLAIYAAELRRPHTEGPDLAGSLKHLTGYLTA